MTTLTELRQRAEAMPNFAQGECDYERWDKARAALLEAVARVEEGIKEIAEQHLPSEDVEVAEDGDYEGAYIILVTRARALLGDEGETKE